MNQDKSARYHTLKRRAAFLSVGWSAAFLFVFAFTPASAWLASLATGAVSRLHLPASLAATAVVLIYVSIFGLLHEAGSLPIVFYRGFLVERRYGLSTESLRSWAVDQVKAGVLGMALSLAGFALLYMAIRRWPHGWWLAAAVGLRPVHRRHGSPGAGHRPAAVLQVSGPSSGLTLRERLAGMARRAGLPVTGVHEWLAKRPHQEGQRCPDGVGQDATNPGVRHAARHARGR